MKTRNLILAVWVFSLWPAVCLGACIVSGVIGSHEDVSELQVYSYVASDADGGI